MGMKSQNFWNKLYLAKQYLMERSEGALEAAVRRFAISL